MHRLDACVTLLYRIYMHQIRTHSNGLIMFPHLIASVIMVQVICQLSKKFNVKS